MMNPLQNWTTAQTNMSTPNAQMYGIYSENSYDPDCIFIFGGNNDGYGKYCYHLSNGTWESLGGVPNHVKNPVSSNVAFFVPDTAVYISLIGNVHTIALNTNSDSFYDQLKSYTTQGCVVKHPNNTNYVFIVALYTNRMLFMFNYNTKIAYEVSTLLTSHIDGTCVVNNYNTSNYLYVMGGSSDYVERINLDNLIDYSIYSSEWNNTNFENIPNSDKNASLSSINDNLYRVGSGITFDYFNGAYFCSCVSYEQFIYIIGCAEDSSGSSPTNNVIYLDVENWVLKYWGNVPNALRSVTAMLSSFVVFFGFRLFCLQQVKTGRLSLKLLRLYSRKLFSFSIQNCQWHDIFVWWTR